jgi:acetyl-CoA carboxylase beta subunit
MFSELPLSGRLDALLGAYTPLATDSAGDLRVVEARVAGQSVIVVGFDGDRQRGSLGVHEADQLVTALRSACRDDSPVVFLMDTAGVRVTEGIAAVAALRRWLRAALDAALDGVPMLALITRNCFGGASVLSTLCDRRVVNRNSLTAMSGPRLIAQMAGTGDPVAADDAAGRALLGGEARARASSGFVLIDDDARSYRDHLTEWVRTQRPLPTPALDIVLMLDRLRDRLRAANRWHPEAIVQELSNHPLQPVVDELLGTRSRLLATGAFLRADVDARLDARLFGLIGGGLAGPEDVQRLTEAIARLPGSVKRLFLLLDCESHSARADDERLVLSEFLGSLALQVRMRHRRQVHVRVVVTGVAGGGIFAALASAASSVWMLPSARLCVLPTAAMQAISKTEGEWRTSPARALEAGAVDALLGDLTEVSAIGQ